MENRLFRYYSEVEPQPVDWLWYPYLPYGKITLLQGDPGEGKSTFSLQLAAILTKGAALPDGQALKRAESVIYQCGEDDNEDTIKPRLLAAGADCTRVAFIEDAEGTLTLDDDRIAEVLETTRARLLIIDPIQSYIRQDGDMQSATRMRAILTRLSRMAAKYRCAILLVGHLNKASGGKTLYRGLGSIDIAAIARSVLMIVRDEHNGKIRYMIPIKSNLAPQGSPIGFVLDQDAGFHWLGKCSLAFEELPFQTKSTSKKETAKDLLRVILSSGLVESKVVYERLQELDISERTVRTAAQEMEIKSTKQASTWYMSLPDEALEEQ